MIIMCMSWAWLILFQRDRKKKEREKGEYSRSVPHFQANWELFVMNVPASIKGISSI